MSPVERSCFIVTKARAISFARWASKDRMVTPSPDAAACVSAIWRGFAGLAGFNNAATRIVEVRLGGRADAARRGGPPGVALTRGEVSLADADARVDRASDRRRGRRADRAGLRRRGGAGGGLVRVSAGARAAPLRERDRPGAGGGRAAGGPTHARAAAQPVHGPGRVPERVDRPDGAPGRPGRARLPRRAGVAAVGGGPDPRRWAPRRAVPDQPAAQIGRASCRE